LTKQTSTGSKRVFIIQKKIISIMEGVKEECLAENYLRDLVYSPVWVNYSSHYCWSLQTAWRSFKPVLTYLHNIEIRHKHDLHVPNYNLTTYQKGIFYTGLKLFLTLPCSITSLSHDMKVFKPALRGYVLYHSFYSVEVFTSIENS
jgi:hypothetical protein